MNKKNYEALGKYTEAKENAIKYYEKRTKAISEVETLLQKTHNVVLLNSYNNLDFNKLDKLIDDAKEENSNFLNWANIANINAPLCEQKKISIRE